MKLLFSIVVIAVFFLFPLFHSGFYDSHDGEAQVARFAAYYQAFQDGQIPPRWAGNLNFGYGTPVFIFYYPLPGYIASLIHVFGFDFETIFKLLIGINFLAAPIFFYIWIKQIFKKETALMGAFFYGLAPYHILNLYVRGDVAETMAFAFIPLVFWTIEKILKTKKLFYALLGGAFYCVLILSHNGVSLMFTPVFLIYIFIRNSDKKIFLQLLSVIFIGLTVSSFFWIPALYERKYINAKLFVGNMYKDHFPTASQIIVSNWGFGTDVQKQGGLSPQIGLLYFSFVILSFTLLIKEKKQRLFIGTWIGVFIIAIFISLSISDILWRNIAILRLYEFPWRFIGLASFASTVLVCVVLNKIKDKKILIVIFLLLILMSTSLVKVKNFVTRNDNFYQSFTGTTDYHGQASSIWTAGDPGRFAKQQIEIIGGNGSVSNVYKKTQMHTFTINAKDKVVLVDNTIYFPGWQVNVDGKKIPIQFQDPNHRGLISFEVPQGRHSIKVFFGESPVRFLSNIISLISLFIVVVLFACALFYNKKVKHL